MRTAFAVVVAALVVFGNGCSKISKAPESNGAVSGTIETDQTRLASRYGGRVIEMFVQEGDTVSSNQLIVRLSAPELSTRRNQLAAQLAEWKAGSRKEELATAKAEMEAVAADLEFARNEERRTAQLANTGAIAASERDRALSRANTLEKSLAASKSRLDLLQAGTRPERIAASEAQLAEVETQIKELEVRAPAPAVVETVHVKLGDVLPPNTPVATLLYTNHLWLRVYVPATWLGHLHLGDKVQVRVDSFADKKFEGEVEQIARSAEFTPRNVQTQEDRIKQVFGVKVRVPSGNGDLRAGMSADVFFNIPKAK
ncbi:MAG TPA: efflux RND transporter periplasmic adaptor subunit [Verrucomicrobiae bacterium]|nr:efflux RND transporter periplasmic adaptor subunit [Verrucomicrobiae bacterium]